MSLQAPRRDVYRSARAKWLEGDHDRQFRTTFLQVVPRERAPQTATRLTGSAIMRLSLSVALVPSALGATHDAGCPGI